MTVTTMKKQKNSKLGWECLKTWAAIFQVGIFRVRIFQWGVWWVGIFRVGVFLILIIWYRFKLNYLVELFVKVELIKQDKVEFKLYSNLRNAFNFSHCFPRTSRWLFFFNCEDPVLDYWFNLWYTTIYYNCTTLSV